MRRSWDAVRRFSCVAGGRYVIGVKTPTRAPNRASDTLGEVFDECDTTDERASRLGQDVSINRFLWGQGGGRKQK
jgi:hypothetical protein